MKGQKTGGRVVGSVNLTKKQTKELLAIFMQEKFEEVKTAWERLDDLNKVKAYITLVRYIMPTLSSVKVEDNSGDDILKKILEAQK